MIVLEGVSKSYDGGESFAVRDVDLEVAAGELLVLLGPSGCGKTTTLMAINRLVTPTAGRVLVEGRDVAGADPVALRRGIGYVFQEVGLFPHWDVFANVATVPRLCGWERERVTGRVTELLELVGLDPAVHGARRPDELSGGQAQRVGVARALAAEPRILLMDEPFGALDPLTRDDLQRELGQLVRRLGLTVVLVTHDVTEALFLADRIAVFDAGRIAASGTPAELLLGDLPTSVRSILETPRRQARRLAELMGEGP